MQNILCLAKKVDLVTVKLPEDLVDEFLENVFEIKNAISNITKAFRNSDGLYEDMETLKSNDQVKTRYKYYGLDSSEKIRDHLITDKFLTMIASIYKTRLYSSNSVYLRFCPLIIDEQEESESPDSYMLVKTDAKTKYDGHIIHIQNIDGDKLLNLHYVFKIIEWFDYFHREDCMMHYRGFSEDL